MSGVNKHVLVGRLGRDPEVRHTNSGKKVVTFSLAVSKPWRDKATGERKETTSWHNVVVFNERIAEVAEKYLKKGAQAFVTGEVLTREYIDRDGVKRRVTETVLQDFSGELVLLDRAEKKDPDPDGYDAGPQDPAINDEIPL